MMKVVLLISLLAAVQAFVPNTFVEKSRTCRKMFTGIVEEMGTVKSLEQRDDMVLWYVVCKCFFFSHFYLERLNKITFSYARVICLYNRCL